jgi:hypothetical protein
MQDEPALEFDRAQIDIDLCLAIEAGLIGSRH